MSDGRRVAPVDVACLPRSALPPWPAVADPWAQAQTAVDWVLVHAPQQVVRYVGPWQDATCAAAMASARAGRRVVWLLEGPTPPDGVALAQLAVAGIPLKLVVPLALLVPWPTTWPAGWWVMVSGDAGEVAAQLAQHLRDEFPCLFVVGEPCVDVPPWPRDQAWEPGQGRVVRAGAGAVRWCTWAGVAEALAMPGPVAVASSLAPPARLVTVG